MDTLRWNKGLVHCCTFYCTGSTHHGTQLKQYHLAMKTFKVMCALTESHVCWGQQWNNEKSHEPPPYAHEPQAVVLSIAAYLPLLSPVSLAGSSGHRHISCDPCYLAGPSLHGQFIFVPSHVPVVYPGVCSGWGVQQIQLRTERMGIWGAVAP